MKGEDDMEKIYGYKQKDVSDFIEFLKKRKNTPLTSVFKEYAFESGKSKGTIRNMYYSIVKKSISDGEFTNKYFDGVPLKKQTVKEFTSQEESALIKNILQGKRQGKSVRSIILELSGGDEKKALRYQNKYRNILKNNQPLVSETVKEIRAENGLNYDPFEYKDYKSVVPDYQLKRLQTEINGLIERVTDKLKRENAYLKGRVGELEVENLKLKNMLYGGDVSGKLTTFFGGNGEKDLLN